MKVLIVEDEKTLALEIESFLKQAFYICDLAHNVDSATDYINSSKYDFILIDLGLPDGNGLDILRLAKKVDNDAIYIIITARNTLDDKVNGLDLGADDYLAKPFFLPELQARMQAIARRKFKISNENIQIGDFEIDLTKRLVYHQKISIELSKKEFDIFSYLLLHKNRVLTRIQLSEHIWGTFADDDYESNYIDAHIKNIRKKLGDYAPTTFLETVRGVGYRIKKN